MQFDLEQDYLVFKLDDTLETRRFFATDASLEHHMVYSHQNLYSTKTKENEYHWVKWNPETKEWDYFRKEQVPPRFLAQLLIMGITPR